MNCDVCKEPIKGPRFSCIHCLHGLNLCLECEGAITNENDPQKRFENHTPRHIFQIFFETSYPVRPVSEWVMVDDVEDGGENDRKKPPAEEERSNLATAYKFAADFLGV